MDISTTILALSKINSGAATGYSYGYDQLNRLVEMRQHTTGTTGGWNNSNIVTAYRESIAYDANGNILKYLRNGTAATPNMDSLTYNYNLDANGKITDNKLNYVRDQVSSSNYSVDIDNQSANNYVYDLIGNLKKDVSEGIDTIRWTVYGKINKIVKNSNAIKINYGYDAGGNRTTKVVSGSADTTTFYVRDAQGNVLAIYTKQNTDPIKWSEQDLYGSSRLGLWRWDTIVPTAPPVVTGSPIYDSLLLGSRTYELTNHLGNVLATISDKKIGNDSSGVANYYIAEVLSQNDYYPFGMLMPARNYDAGARYRYGFNGKENDNEVKGEGNDQDYGMRIYDPRLGRFLSMDPIFKVYPWLTPYQFAANKPITSIDVDGLEDKKMIFDVEISPKGETTIKVTVSSYGTNGGSGPRGKGILLEYNIDRRKEVKNDKFGMPGNMLDKTLSLPGSPESIEVFVPEPVKPKEGLFQRLDNWEHKFSGKDADQAGGFVMTKPLTEDAHSAGGDSNAPNATHGETLDNAELMIEVIGLAGGVEEGTVANIWNKNKKLGEKLTSLFEMIGHSAKLSAALTHAQENKLEEINDEDQETLEPNQQYSLDFDPDRISSAYGILTDIRTGPNGKVKDTIKTNTATSKFKSDTIPNKHYKQ